jgi:hypothetical protein
MCVPWIHSALKAIWCQCCLRDWVHKPLEWDTNERYFQNSVELFGRHPLWISSDSWCCKSPHILVRTALGKQSSLPLCNMQQCSFNLWSQSQIWLHLWQNSLGLHQTSIPYSVPSSYAELCTYSNVTTYACLKPNQHFWILEVYPPSWWRPPLSSNCKDPWEPMKINVKYPWMGSHGEILFSFFCHAFKNI